MIDKHLLCWAIYERLLHLVDTTGRVEVETENKIGYFEKHVALVGMLIVANYLIGIGHPLKEVRVLVGHDYSNILSARTQELSPT